MKIKLSTNSIRQNILLFCMAFFYVIVLFFISMMTKWRILDSLITFRFAQNMANGNGLVYNIGERVSGNTSLLYSAILGLLGAITGNIEISALIFGLLSFFITFIIVFKLLSLKCNYWIALVLSTTICMFPLTSIYAICGMETQLYILIILLSVLLALKDQFRLMAICSSLLIFIRPDAVVFYAAFVLYYLIYNRRQAATLAVLYFLIVLSYFYSNFLYYDSWIPNTMLAKRVVYASNEMSYHHLISQYFKSHFVFVILFLGLIIGSIRKNHVNRILGISSIFYLVYLIIAPTVRSWYVTPFIYLSALSWMILLCPFLIHFFQRKSFLWLFCMLVVFTYGYIYLYKLIPQMKSHRELEVQTRIIPGEWLHRNADPDARLFVTALETGYYAKLYTIDWPGLVCPAVWKAVQRDEFNLFDFAAAHDCQYVLVGEHSESTGIYLPLKKFHYQGGVYFSESGLTYVLYATPEAFNRLRDAL